MGILHLAGLGLSPGAVTCGLSYLRQLHSQRTSELGKIVDEVVVFTSREVAHDKMIMQGEAVLNRYGTSSQRRTWTKEPVLDVLAVGLQPVAGVALAAVLEGFHQFRR